MIDPAPPPSALRLLLDGATLVANWRWLRARGGGAACGAAIKADGYGLGAAAVRDRLAAAGCRHFFVSTWAEAAALGPWPDGLELSVLHGVRDEDLSFALSHRARPVLNTADQIARWCGAGGGAADVMVDTGMNRLGLPWEEAATLTRGQPVATLMSHLACADEPENPLNALQRDRFRALAATIPARQLSLANSAGICLGEAYGFDLTRPGLALYGGIPAAAAAGGIAPVVRPHAQLVQKRVARAGEGVGYGATFRPVEDQPLAILNLGYADGYLRALGTAGNALIDGARCPVVGRISMDLIAVAVPAGPWEALREGDWIEIAFDLPETAEASGLSQYELLTALGDRYGRSWTC